MTQEEKDLLLKILCEQLPYGVKVCYKIHKKDKPVIVTLSGLLLDYVKDETVVEIKPYLRLMSSMTEEEEHELLKFGAVTHLSNDEVIDVACVGFEYHAKVQDWLNAHHFDYRGLIERGLALEATEEMYKWQ